MGGDVRGEEVEGGELQGRRRREGKKEMEVTRRKEKRRDRDERWGHVRVRVLLFF